MVALVLKSGLAEYFEPVSFDTRAGDLRDQAQGRPEGSHAHPHDRDGAAGVAENREGLGAKSFLASGWGRNPTDMLVARATSRLARMVYPDLLAGLYTPEELAEIREDKQGAA
jgi:hypothetical protein